MKISRGWISVPIMLAIMIFSLLMVHQQAQFNSLSKWLLRQSTVSSMTRWQTIPELLKKTKMDIQMETECPDFCAPRQGYWATASLEGQAVWLQRQKLEVLGIERHCARFDQVLMRCWWYSNNTLLSSMFVNY